MYRDSEKGKARPRSRNFPLARRKTHIGRLWTYVRDDRPFAGPDPPAAIFFYSRDRGGDHAERHLASYAGLM
jgi:transposase